jgi:hypothetical protein
MSVQLVTRIRVVEIVPEEDAPRKSDWVLIPLIVTVVTASTAFWMCLGWMIGTWIDNLGKMPK